MSNKYHLLSLIKIASNEKNVRIKEQMKRVGSPGQELKMTMVQSRNCWFQW